MGRNSMNDDLPSGPSVDKDQKNGIVTRRRALMMGAVTASAVVSIKPALAQTAGSVLNCEIPVPGNHAAGGYIAPERIYMLCLAANAALIIPTYFNICLLSDRYVVSESQVIHHDPEISGCGKR